MIFKLSNMVIRKFRCTNVLLTELFIVLTSIVSCFVASFYLLFTQGPFSLLYYGDSVSHMIISRRIFDSIIPGITQLGGVWLPMSHIMLAPFVANDLLFQTGLAGTFVSSICTCVTDVLIFRIVKIQYNSKPAGLLASVLYLMNPSVIYMGVVPMMEAPFMMFFMLSLYFFQKWYYIYINNGDVLKQYTIIIKCALSISAACLTRYEGWLLPVILIFAILLILLFTTQKPQKHRIQAFLFVVIIFSSAGILSWIFWNMVIFRDPLFFATGPYSAQVQAGSRAYSAHLHLQPVVSLYIILDAASAMYGIPILIISLLGIASYLFMHKKNVLSFRILTVIMLMAPTLADYAAMIQGSGEIYPVGEKAWFNGRYLIFIAPLIAFGSTSLVIFASKIRKRGKTLITYIVYVTVVVSYIFIFVTQPLEVGKTTAMADTVLLPFRNADQVIYQTGRVMGKLYNGTGNIVLFTPNQVGQQLMFASGLRLNRFIDVAAGYYWNTSKDTPWIYGQYLVLAKPVLSESTTFEPTQKIINHWQSREATLLIHYRAIYENQYFKIFVKRVI
jgi:4-amino-4-deoxy-L-arabinose transferase-like glycosyltransferase